MEDKNKIHKLYRSTDLNEFIDGMENLSVESLEKILANAVLKQNFEVARILRNKISIKKQPL